MPAKFQKRIMRDGHSKVGEKYIFAKYCPNAPHNTTQFLSKDFNHRFSLQHRMQMIENLLEINNNNNEFYEFRDEPINNEKEEEKYK